MEALFQAVDPVVRQVMVGPMDRYAGIEAAVVAGALLSLCENGKQPGVFRHENRKLQELAG